MDFNEVDRQPWFKRKLGFKLAVAIITVTAIIFLTILLVSYYSLKTKLIEKEHEIAKELAQATVYRLEMTLQAVEEIAEGLAVLVEQNDAFRLNIIPTMQALLRENPEIYGLGLALEPYALDSQTEFYAPYFYRRNQDLELIFLGRDGYFYQNWSWYQKPQKLQRPVWSEPYEDEHGGDFIKSTYAVPIFRKMPGRNTFFGVVKVDLNLIWLQEVVANVKILQTGFAFLVSKEGYFVTLPRKENIMKDSIFFLADVTRQPRLAEIGRAMIEGQEGFATLRDFLSGKQSWIYYAPLPSTGWSLGVIFPEDELLADLHSLMRQLLVMSLSGLILLLGLIMYLSRRITHPLSLLDRKIQVIAHGNLNIDLPEPTSSDEIGTLTLSFREMQAALREYIADLAESTVARERIESELKIAHAIQMSFLPKRFPPLARKDLLDIAAFLEPAREVGGDLYDYFLLDDHRLFFAIGDVSDKGVPAALFMAVTKTLLKGLAEVELKPDEILQRVNLELSRENEANMFATVFCGILNLQTGALTYANAGHNPPVLLRTGAEPDWLPMPAGVFLGVFATARYQSQTIYLQPGDRLLTYTDGITEAVNESQELFEGHRLLATLKEVRGRTVTEMINAVMAGVKAFTRQAPQSDDITLLALHFKGQPGARN